jgi:carbon-monoxide dehydrogenase medium subunit
MYPTTYHRPKSLAEAKTLFEACDDAAFLSGGHTLIPTLKQRLANPSDLIDLAAISELKGVTAEAGRITIGAYTRHAEVAASAIVKAAIPALAGLAGSIGDRHVRHRGTIGGSVANNDPAADYPAAVLGLGATIVTDRRRIPADRFFVSLYETALEPGEILTRIVFPLPDAAGYAKFRSAASRYSIVGVFVSRTGADIRVAVTGAGAAGVFRARALEQAMSTDFSVRALEGLTVEPGKLMADLNGSAEYRAHLVMVMARRAVGNMNKVGIYN